jgi:hypothetical protein
MWLFEITSIFIIPILSIIGFVFNILSTIVFSLIIKNGQRDDMYKHLLLKSICEALACFFSSFYPLYYYGGTLSFAYIVIIWYIWFERYVIPVLFMASVGFEIAATFNCAISIEKRMKWCEKRLSFWLWVFFIIISSFGVEIYPPFTYSIMKVDYQNEFNETFSQYGILSESFTLKMKRFGLAESIIKEIMFLLILLSLNIYILVKLFEIGRRKKRLTTNSSNARNSRKAENRKIIMIIVLFLTFLLGHLPNVIYFAVNNGIYDYFWFQFKLYGLIFLYLSYSTSFFVYFAFNNTFRGLFLKINPL